MSKYKPIPESLKHEFLGYMSSCDDDELPDGAWFQVLEDSAQSFMDDKKIKGDSNSAAHQYLIWRSK